MDRSLRERAVGVGLLGVLTAALGLLAWACPEHSTPRELLAMLTAMLGLFFLPVGVLIVAAEAFLPEGE